MKFTIEIDTTRSPDAVGEYLRSEFFAEDPEDEISLGCYTTHDWRDDVESLPSIPVDQTDWIGQTPDLLWTRGRKNDIECRWYWDGDGILEFHLPTGEELINTDCKHTHGWELYEPGERSEAEETS